MVPRKRREAFCFLMGHIFIHSAGLQDLSRVVLPWLSVYAIIWYEAKSFGIWESQIRCPILLSIGSPNFGYSSQKLLALWWLLWGRLENVFRSVMRKTLQWRESASEPSSQHHSLNLVASRYGRCVSDTWTPKAFPYICRVYRHTSES